MSTEIVVPLDLMISADMYYKQKLRPLLKQRYSDQLNVDAFCDMLLGAIVDLAVGKDSITGEEIQQVPHIAERTMGISPYAVGQLAAQFGKSKTFCEELQKKYDAAIGWTVNKE